MIQIINFLQIYYIKNCLENTIYKMIILIDEMIKTGYNHIKLRISKNNAIMLIICHINKNEPLNI